ncbi:MAG: ChbG/HpnK family deacetylase [Acidobacteria bacterium]|nr:ChbG/HpnK family deacetylase [Acidobacteriota bacterium]
MIRRLILNADDYGLCSEVNVAIEELIEAGRLNDVSVLANGNELDSAVRFLRAHTQVSIGVHLNAIEGLPLSNAANVKNLIGSNGTWTGLRKLMLRWAARPTAVSRVVELEWRMQIELLLERGLRLSHADSHQHVHAFPPAWRIAVKLCSEYGIPSLRFPRERNALPMRRVGAFALGASLAASRLMAGGTGLRHNEHFLGFKRAGAYGFQELVNDLRQIPAGVAELALHPSTADGIPYPNLFGNHERLALLDSSWPEAIAELGIELTTWKDIANDREK